MSGDYNVHHVIYDKNIMVDYNMHHVIYDKNIIVALSVLWRDYIGRK